MLMIISLENKVRRQLAGNVQPEGFLNSWRLFHFALRSYLINKLCDEEAMQRLIEVLPADSLPSEEERTEHPSPNVRATGSLESYLMRKFASVIDDAPETDLLGKYSPMITGVDLRLYLQTKTPQLWTAYIEAARHARHHVAHGKVFGRRAHMGLSFNELTESMLQAFGVLHFLFRGDEYFEHVVIGGPLPPFCKYSYDPSTELLTISEDPDLILPEYREQGDE